MRILLLGGTTEASRMARALAEAGLPAVFSYAGRTAAPVAQPLPLRVGGFGGTEGLAAYIREEGITHVIDATHPFAAQMSRNAVEACAATGTALVALERAPWAAGPGDRWIRVPSIEAAAEALPEAPARVFLAIGRLHLAAFAGRAQHHYLLRLVDPPDALPLPRAEAIVARGPFTLAEDLELLRRHEIQWIVAKNAGGEGARAKLDAARELGLPVVLIDRPAIPPRPRVETPEAVLGWLAHPADLGV
ncbi:cobalt-precorrin-6A reductase [Rhodobacter sphaeroides]|uniref:Precorrin-6A reductase n=1 Tax=Cereibacter sphaeroides (strain ATCC 17023 / DSM 158 / JCM 6121 / CCUG 31486 / LMG 2827 / NBRC 12203 / NCIMB 8253 / ATH 2.4.1.) TaxID=272943 RepID=Q3J2J6_CERS4|nr:cobalt-precorrin-6A reductase [Cereibacter sphaeroides]ABA78988.1 precorrin-6A reductase [Cereibacter sphaeroides 2.4.1]AMJ47309.1 cobalt-precorrin-6X reductase [Cereibacter sphaeroides]ANS34022.1 cobalt-precorrin-6A reductase [Cereibacter sphaeroides]ATN63066.1 cobalt-precorrin-6A reductase [Cereibacter sphaeroides]AXC61194.1 cobalt-precorrin-6A reductase [Cereibacter sphaeroides 2.4.1]